MGTLTNAEMTDVLQKNIINRGDADTVTLYGYALDWALSYLDRTSAARGYAFSDLNREDVGATTISDPFTTSNVDYDNDKITVDIDIPRGTRIRFTTTEELPNIACTFTATDVDAETDIITVSIDIATDTEIIFSNTGGTLPDGLSLATTYLCVRQSATTIKVTDTNGVAIDIIDEGSGTHTVTTDNGGLNVDTDYWAIKYDGTIKVSQTYLKAWQGTDTIDITDTGSGTHTVTAYRERFAKPLACRNIYDIRLIDGAMSRKLIPMPPRRLDLFEPFAASCNPAKPTHYIEWKDWIQLYPIPDDTYVLKMRYYKWQEFDTDDKAEIDHIDDIIIKAAAIHVWQILGEPEQAAIMEKAVEVALIKCGKLERMKPDLVLKPYGGTIARADSDTIDDPFVRSQR